MGGISKKIEDIKGTVHFIGALGSGCYPLAKLLRARGYTVTGSDASVHVGYTDSDGIELTPPQRELSGSVELAVYSLAISEDDPEILSARRRGVMLISRAQLLGALMSLYRVRISVSGSHGKSTTTALIESILASEGLKHTAVSGAKLATGATYCDSGGDVFLTEACEYKDSFLCLCPTHQIITSVELDHTDYFDSLESIRSSFLVAARMAQVVIINCDDPVARSIADELSGRTESAGKCEPHTRVEKTAINAKNTIVTYGKGEGADYRFHTVHHDGDITRFAITHKGRTKILETPLIGEYNLYNVTCAYAVADTLGTDEKSITEAISHFRGIERRASIITHIGGVPVYYDYAHHPSEIAAVISALKSRYDRVTAIFRPHTYTRTRSLWQDFVTTLSMADRVILLDVFAAREAPIPGVSSEALAKAIRGAIYTRDSHDAARLATDSGADVIVLLGAGDVEDVKNALLELGNKNSTERI